MVTKTLLELVEASGKTQKQIALELGLTQQRFNFYVSGKREPDTETLSHIANYFDVTIDYLVTGKKNKPTTHEGDELMKLLQEPINKEFFELLSKVSPKTREGALAQLRVLAGLEDKQ